jgi:hypothetical protein
MMLTKNKLIMLVVVANNLHELEKSLMDWVIWKGSQLFKGEEETIRIKGETELRALEDIIRYKNLQRSLHHQI